MSDKEFKLKELPVFMALIKLHNKMIHEAEEENAKLREWLKWCWSNLPNGCSCFCDDATNPLLFCSNCKTYNEIKEVVEERSSGGKMNREKELDTKIEVFLPMEQTVVVNNPPVEITKHFKIKLNPNDTISIELSKDHVITFSLEGCISIYKDGLEMRVM